MRFTVQYPMQRGTDPRLLRPDVVAEFVRVAEEAGYDAVAFTEHPAPSEKWITHGGHESFDPLTVLAFVAARTSRLRLMTYLLVLPYRNPFLAAKQVATLDVLSGGRVVLGVGGGYLRSEFAALGVDFDERNALFDEAADVMRRIWTTDDLAYEGRHFRAPGQTQAPRPVQQPHTPLWVGGNSRRARERAAAYGQGWTPLLIDEQMSATTRTPPLASPAALRAAVDDLRELTAAAGRDPDDVCVQVEWQPARVMTTAPEQARDLLGQLAAAGAGQVVVEPPYEDAEHALDTLRAYGADVVAPASAAP